MTTKRVFSLLCILWLVLPGMLPPLGERGTTVAASDALGALTLLTCFCLLILHRPKISSAYWALFVHVVVTFISCLIFLDDPFFVPSVARALRFLFILSPALLFIFIKPSAEEVGKLVAVYLTANIFGIAFPLIAYALGRESAQASQMIDLDAVGGLVRRAGGWVGDSSAFGHQIASLVIVTIAAIFSRTKGFGFWTIMVVPVAAYGLYATSSRSAFVTIAAVFIFIYFFGKGSIFKRTTFVATGLAVAAIIIAIAYAFGLFQYFEGYDIVVDRLLAPLQIVFGGQSAADVSSGRLENWARMFAQFNWSLIAGVGYGSLALKYGIADNVFIKTLGETGVLGVSSLIAMFALLFRRFYRYRKTNIGNFGLILLVGQLVNAMFVDTSTFYSSMPPVILILFAAYSSIKSSKTAYLASMKKNK